MRTSQQVSFPKAPKATYFDDVALVENDWHSALVFTVACHVVHDVKAAEYISQEVFLQLWRKPKSYDSQSGVLATWLAVITRHRAIDYEETPQRIES
jgi:DNA-directed RNA polymerase specialized sigma24 family protein